MNPYTRSLLAEIDDPDLHTWVEAWDQLEALVVKVYRGRAAQPQEEREYSRLRLQLQGAYSDWQSALEPHWRGLMAGGEPLDQDPFKTLIEPEQVSDFVENWRAMQTLPAAREALNAYLIARTEREGGPDVDSRA